MIHHLFRQWLHEFRITLKRYLALRKERLVRTLHLPDHQEKQAIERIQENYAEELQSFIDT